MPIKITPPVLPGVFEFEIRLALERARAAGLDVTLNQQSRHWICAVNGEVAHIDDLPQLVDAAIAKKQKPT
jgi:hypothetical protein